MYHLFGFLAGASTLPCTVLPHGRFDLVLAGSGVVEDRGAFVRGVSCHFLLPRAHTYVALPYVFRAAGKCKSLGIFEIICAG